MKKATWAAAGVGFAVGALAVLGAKALMRTADGPTMNAEVATIEAMSDTPQLIATAQSVPSSDSSAVVPPVIDRAPEHVQQLPWHAALVAATPQYALTLQPGVWGGEPLPQFVLDELGREPYLDGLTAHEKHRATPSDGWSYEMEFRLRNFFDAQPEISKFRISIDCRTSGCELQLTDLPLSLEEIRSQAESGLPSKIAVARLIREAWYDENFSRAQVIRTPQSIGTVRYLLLMLERRQ